MVLIIGLAGQAPSRRRPLSSNVRPHRQFGTFQRAMQSCAGTSSQSHAGASRLRTLARHRRSLGRTLSPRCTTQPFPAQALAVRFEDSTKLESRPPLPQVQPEEDTSLLVALTVRGVALMSRAPFCQWLRRSSSFVPRQERAFAPGFHCRVRQLPAHATRCGLTLRWSGRPPASQLGREALSVYHAPRGQAGLPASAPQLKR